MSADLDIVREALSQMGSGEMTPEDYDDALAALDRVEATLAHLRGGATCGFEGWHYFEDGLRTCRCGQLAPNHWSAALAPTGQAERTGPTAAELAALVNKMNAASRPGDDLDHVWIRFPQEAWDELRDAALVALADGQPARGRTCPREDCPGQPEEEA